MCKGDICNYIIPPRFVFFPSNCQSFPTCSSYSMKFPSGLLHISLTPPYLLLLPHNSSHQSGSIKQHAMKRRRSISHHIKSHHDLSSVSWCASPLPMSPLNHSPHRVTPHASPQKINQGKPTAQTPAPTPTPPPFPPPRLRQGTLQCACR